MDIFSVEFTPQELSILRQALDVIHLTGKDAKTIANLQVKLESEIAAIASILSQTSQTSNTKKVK